MTKIERAIGFALEAHKGQKRKGKDRAYILHPLEVLAIVGSMTEDEDVLAAAVLHDTVEDTGTTPEDIEKEFGPRVRALMMAESEDKMPDSPAPDTWQARKEATLQHLKKDGRDVKLICLGDKLANLREIARDYADLGDKLWQRFNQKCKKQHAWYYGSLCDILEEEFTQISAIEEYRRLLGEVFKTEDRERDSGI